MSDEIICIGYDSAFNANKIARVQGNEILTYVLPSSVEEPNRGNKDGLTLTGVVRPRLATRHPVRVVFDGIEYLVGPNVDDFAEPSTGWISTISGIVPNCEPPFIQHSAGLPQVVARIAWR